ncbi:peptidase [Gemmatirosa kalamazoonensis]|uniref:Peptidase n=1 Tax=Gemmatirosa kalamazoonensis TaxID=861299 RepID=W0RF19_9BACT|nr:M1 family metallopeptidase [Gemmatirosa kalamazoonensis]AHG88930.1 peptidase [Gemmatirosa kalamazoonensis]
MRPTIRQLTALLGVAALGAPTSARAQQQRPPQTPAQREAHARGVGDTSIFAPLDYTSSTLYRSGAGRPGPRYWQNRADYDLHGTLDTAAKSLAGTMTLRYTNNSPDTLTFVWFQVEQNAFRGNSLNSLVFAAESRFGARNFEGGDVLDRFDQVVGGKHSALKTRVEGTIMKVDLAQPLAPGATATFDVAWHFNIPEHGADRMGRDGALYELAQWYPRVCVYDDLRGWNTEPYLGQGEFYLEYGDYNLSVTVPAGYIVAATGALQNASEVLTPTQVQRLAQASKSDTPVHIVTEAELKNGSARPRKTGTLTWRFAAKNVRDAVWAASPDYMWDASSYKGILAMGYYRPSAIETWKDAADMSRMSIQEYSERWFPYPWPHISAVEGPISGMEYPMLAMENKSEDKYDLYNVITHEIGHMWYPMIVGSNERAHMWQDEGFNTFINYYSEGRRFPEKGTANARALENMRLVEQYMQNDVDQPLEINPDRINPALLGENAYVKTAVGLHLLREEILGPDAFDDAFRAYTAAWAFKHPSPADFFRTMENASGKRLDWFWREWFLENPHFDQKIDTVATQMQGDTLRVAVMYGNAARGVLPIHARFTFADGSKEDFDYPAEVWSTNTSHYIRRYAFPASKKLAKIELDPDQRLVDIDRSNNTWPVKAM